MKILAIDQATATGWAVVEGNGQIVASGVWRLADNKRTGESRGMRYLRFWKHLEDSISTYQPRLICHEQTLLRGGAATEIANGLKAFILASAEFHGIDVSCVHTTELKRWATGSGRAEKPDMIRAAVRLSGWPVTDDNEADAILIGLWAAATYGTFPAPELPRKKAPGRRKSARGPK